MQTRVDFSYTALLISFSASDVESDNLTFSITDKPSNGGLGAVSGSQVLYTPNSDFNGSDSFTYQANDGTDDSNTAIVNCCSQNTNTSIIFCSSYSMVYCCL